MHRCSSKVYSWYTRLVHSELCKVHHTSLDKELLEAHYMLLYMTQKREKELTIYIYYHLINTSMYIHVQGRRLGSSKDTLLHPVKSS